MPAQNAIMTKRVNSADRHKPRRMVGVKETLAKQLEALVGRNASEFTQEVNRAVRELLIREGLWPPT